MYSTLPQLLFEKAQKIPERPIQYEKNANKDFIPISYSDFAETMLDFAAGLQSLGAKKADHIGLISDNRQEWLVCSMAIMTLGAADIPRGGEVTSKDLEYILNFAECHTVILESNYCYKKILECKKNLPLLKNLILINTDGVDFEAFSSYGISIHTYTDILKMGKKYRSEHPNEIENTLHSGTESDTATIIFTSGTTGTPKGVELTHKNFLCQLKDVGALLPLKTGDKALCVLPVWHVYEREFEYILIFLECALCYSKPVASMMLSDIKKTNPQFLACVPRLWDAIYKAIQKQLNADKSGRWLLFKTLVGASSTIRNFYDIIHGRTKYYKRHLFIYQILNKALYIPILFMLPFKAWGDIIFFRKARAVFGNGFKLGMSGGGGLSPKLDKFYNSIGMRLVEGYGLTETAPMCCMRNYKQPVLGTIGRILPFCEGRIVNKHGQECKPGQVGVLYIRGENVMKGYYKQPNLTAEAISEGWFNTGDLVVRTYKGDISVRGRQKDTIVLRSGENVEPFPIECKLAESPYISQAVVVGQDKNCLGALIIPQKENLKKFAEENNIDTENFFTILKSDEVHNLIFKEFERLITPKNGFKPFEKIGKFAFIDKQFEVGVELSAKQDIIRHKINDLYKWQIMMMYGDSSAMQNLDSLTQGINSITQGLSNVTQNLSNMKSKVGENLSKMGENISENLNNITENIKSKIKK